MSSLYTKLRYVGPSGEPLYDAGFVTHVPSERSIVELPDGSRHWCEAILTSYADGDIPIVTMTTSPMP